MNHGTDGHTQPDVISRGTVLVGTATVFAVSRFMTARVAIVDQGIDITVGHCPDAATAATIAAVWAASRNEFFAAKRHDAIAPMAGNDFNVRFINKLHGGDPELGSRPNKSPAQAGLLRPLA